MSVPACRSFQALFVIPAGSALHGCTLKDTGFLTLPGLTVANITRDGRTRAADESVELKAGDRMLVEGVPEALAKLRRQRGVRLDSAQVLQLGTRRRRRVLVEVSGAAHMPDVCGCASEWQADGPFVVGTGDPEPLQSVDWPHSDEL